VALTKVLGYRAKSYGFLPLGGRGPRPPTLTSVSPMTITHNVTFTMNLVGTGFTSDMTVRYWDGNGTFAGRLYIPDAIPDAQHATVTVAPSNWATGTGGVDVYTDQPSNQLQFQII
jgi:hypothetical protein